MTKVTRKSAFRQWTAFYMQPSGMQRMYNMPTLNYKLTGEDAEYLDALIGTLKVLQDDLKVPGEQLITIRETILSTIT